MIKLSIAGVAAALSLFILVSGAYDGEIKCTHTLSQYLEVVAQLETEAIKARTLADRNPLYISDVQYYDAVLADTKACIRNLSPVATAAR